MKNTWDEDVDAHEPAECYPCGGCRFYMMPLGCGDPGNECEDENNCYCECHQSAAAGVGEPRTKAGRALLEASFGEEGLPLDLGAAIVAIEAECREREAYDAGRLAGFEDALDGVEWEPR